MCDEIEEDMETDSPKTPLFKYIKSRMSYTGTDNKAVSISTNGTKSFEKGTEAIKVEHVTLGTRLSRRRDLIQRRRWIVDLQFVLAMTGIVLMMIETELYFRQNVSKTSIISLGIKCIISITTGALLISILLNYYTGLHIKVLDRGLKDCVSVITTWNLASLLLELVICAIHPIPGNYTMSYTNPIGQTRNVNIDAFLSILMMTRLYLIGKFAVVHSRLLTDSSTNSIGALSKVKINTKFVFKAAMASKPGLLIFLVMVLTFLVNTWAMRTCEIYFEQKNENNTYIETMWLIAITFLTVGYGDKTPQSYCGRYISVLTGGMGVITTALIVAILARNLQQSRSEKYVFSFVSRLQIENRKKKAAANAIKSIFRIWILKKYGEGNEYEKEIRRYEDRVTQALKEIKATKVEMHHIADDTLGMVDVAHTVNRICDVVEKSSGDHSNLITKCRTIDKRLTKIEEKMTTICDQLSKFMQEQ